MKGKIVIKTFQVFVMFSIFAAIAVIICAFFIHTIKTARDEGIYIPGRDTVEYWEEGKCEILKGENYVLSFNHQIISDSDNYIKAYRQIKNILFFITSNGAIVVDMDADEYTIYNGEEYKESKYGDIFFDQDSFIFLEE